jgi:hypothetical protein
MQFEQRGATRSEHRIEVVMHGLGLAAANKRECSGRH